MKSVRLISIAAAALVFAAMPLRAQAPRWTIGMSQCNLGEPWRVQMNADIKKAAEGHPEIAVIFKDAQNDNLRQVAHLEEFVRAGVNLIIISPKEAAPLTRPVADAYTRGIPVIVLDRAVLGDRYTCFIGANNKKIGRAAGRWIAKLLGGKGNVVELKGLMTSIPGQDRNSGFREGIKGTQVNVVFEADMKWLEPNARKEMESALARFPRIDLVYGHNDPAAHGAYLAAKAAGRTGVLSAKAHVLLQGRFSVSCADIRQYALPVLRHRIFCNFTAASEGVSTDQIVGKILEAVKEPKY